MLRASPPMNWSQISKEIPLSLVIIFHRKWNGGEDGMGEKGGGSQTSVTRIGDKLIFVSKIRIADVEICSGWEITHYVECLLQIFFSWICRKLQHFDNGVGNIWLGSKHNVEQWSNDWLIPTLKSSVCFFVWVGFWIVPGRKRNRNGYAVLLTKSFNDFLHIAGLV